LSALWWCRERGAAPGGNVPWADAGDVASGPIEAGDNPESHGIAADEEDDRYGVGGGFCCLGRWHAAGRDNRGDLSLNKIGYHRG
jgi:hypothetical protein